MRHDAKGSGKTLTLEMVKRLIGREIYPPLGGKSPSKSDQANRLDALYAYWVGCRSGKIDVKELGKKGKKVSKSASKKAKTGGKSAPKSK